MRWYRPNPPAPKHQTPPPADDDIQLSLIEKAIIRDVYGDVEVTVDFAFNGCANGWYEYLGPFRLNGIVWHYFYHV